jgi:ABC-2 type transport system ATP-binding protein
VPDRIDSRDIYVAASHAGMQIRRMHRRRDSLEDIFMRAMDAEPTRGALVHL